jgi:hypothetical protein
MQPNSRRGKERANRVAREQALNDDAARAITTGDERAEYDSKSKNKVVESTEQKVDEAVTVQVGSIREETLLRGRAEAAEAEVGRLQWELMRVKEQAARERANQQTRQQEQKKRRREESTDQQQQTRKMHVKLEAAEQRVRVKLEVLCDTEERAWASTEGLRLAKSRLGTTREKLKDMADARVWLEQAREEATKECADARDRLRDVEEQLKTSEAATRREAEAKGEVEEEMEFQSLVSSR